MPDSLEQAENQGWRCRCGSPWIEQNRRCVLPTVGWKASAFSAFRRWKRFGVDRTAAFYSSASRSTCGTRSRA